MSLPNLSHGFPCRSVTVWIFGFALIFTVMVVWYTMQPVMVSSIHNTQDIAENMSVNETQYNTGIGILEPIANYWGPLVVLGILAVCFISSQRQDWRSGYR